MVNEIPENKYKDDVTNLLLANLIRLIQLDKNKLHDRVKLEYQAFLSSYDNGHASLYQHYLKGIIGKER